MAGAAFVLTLAPGAAEAATTVGQSPPGTGAAAGCGAPSSIDVAQGASGVGNSYVVPPGGGVITSWSTSLAKGTLQMKLRVFSISPGVITPLGESAVETVTTGGATQFSTRVPVAGGEILGLTIPANANDSSEGCLFSGGANTNQVVLANSGAIGQPEPLLETGVGFLVNVAAALEPDLDQDGFGDETQDQCSTQATAGAACDLGVTIGKRPKKKSDSRNATFRFSDPAGGVTFQCRIDKKAFNVCTSPKKFRNLKVRKHRFQVSAVDSKGTVGPPATFRWRVVD